jgi:hypothetical protein
MVKDANNNPLGGVTVTFTAPASGASGTFASGTFAGGTTATATTNGSGLATAPTFTANGTTGSYTVTATVSGVATPAAFNLTNNSSTSSGGGGGGGGGTTVGHVYSAAPVLIPSNGGEAITTGNTTSLSQGYANVLQDGTPNLSGLAIFGFTNNGIVVSETGVPASAPITSGRVYVGVNGPVNTGIAFANPNASSAVISFYFADLNGNTTNQGSFTLNGYSQTAAFMNQAPFNGSSSMEGTFTFSSSGPVATIALRGLTNERGDFIMSTLPVSPLPGIAGKNPVVLPHFADGGGWTTQIILTNLYDTPTSGYLQFFSPGDSTQGGAVLSMSINGVMGNTFNYTIPGHSAVRYVTGNLSPSVQAGSVQLTSSDGYTPSMSAVFSYRNNGVTVTEAGVSAVPTSTAFRMYSEISSDPTNSIASGVALANPTGSSVTVTIQAVGMNGISTLPALNLTLPPNGQSAQFVNQLFPNLVVPFRGFLTFTATSPVSITGLRTRYNARNDFLITTTPARDDNAFSSSGLTGSGLVFPDVVSGAGYTTELIIYGGSAATGTLWFGAVDPSVLSTLSLVQ